MHYKKTTHSQTPISKREEKPSFTTACPEQRPRTYTTLLALLMAVMIFAATKSGAQTIASSSEEIQAKPQAPISIEADSAEQDEKLGITTYKGNVAIVQGPLSIKADRVHIISMGSSDKRSVEKISASGNPAIFTHQASSPADSIIAQAQKIDYQLKPGIVILRNSASLVQQGSSVSGELIEYFIAEKRVKAQAGGEKTSGKSDRVRTVITPGAGILFNTGD